jgi:hypothetical protein
MRERSGAGQMENPCRRRYAAQPAHDKDLEGHLNLGKRSRSWAQVSERMPIRSPMRNKKNKTETRITRRSSPSER